MNLLLFPLFLVLISWAQDDGIEQEVEFQQTQDELRESDWELSQRNHEQRSINDTHLEKMNELEKDLLQAKDQLDQQRREISEVDSEVEYMKTERLQLMQKIVQIQNQLKKESELLKQKKRERDESREQTRKLHKALYQKEMEAYDIELEKLVINSELERQKQAQSQWQRKIDAKDRELSETHAQIIHIKNQIRSAKKWLHSAISQNEKEIRSYDQRIQNARNRQKQLLSGNKGLKQKWDLSIEKKKEIAAQLEELENQIDQQRIRQNAQKDVEKIYKDRHRSMYRAYEQKKNRYQSRVNELQAQMDEQKEKLTQLKNQLLQMKKASVHIHQKDESLDQRLESLARQIEKQKSLNSKRKPAQAIAPKVPKPTQTSRKPSPPKIKDDGIPMPQETELSFDNFDFQPEKGE